MTKEEKEILIQYLQKKINIILIEGGNMESTNWNYEEGVLISGDEAKEFIRLLKKEL